MSDEYPQYEHCPACNATRTWNENPREDDAWTRFLCGSQVHRPSGSLNEVGRQCMKTVRKERNMLRHKLAQTKPYTSGNPILEYEQWVQDTDGYDPEKIPLPKEVLYALGLGGEAGEILDEIKKVYRDDRAVLSVERKQKLVLELGDLLWYFTKIIHYTGLSIAEIAAKNVEKLEQRRSKKETQNVTDG